MSIAHKQRRPAAGMILRLSLPPRRTSARELRATLAGYLASSGVPRATSDQVLLAADEAFVNAFLHSGDVAGVVEMRAQVLDGEVLVEIRDRGCGFEARAVDVDTMPDPLVTHGRGLFLIHHLMDKVEVRSPATGRGTLVCMAKRFSRRASPIVESIG
jgi:anti-sigma regulatory factor (Ser/Thr protein kinase)